VKISHEILARLNTIQNVPDFLLMMLGRARNQSSQLTSPRRCHRTQPLVLVDRHADDVIVTPFAQILHSLRNVHSSYVLLTDVSPSSRYFALNPAIVSK